MRPRLLFLTVSGCLALALPAQAAAAPAAEPATAPGPIAAELSVEAIMARDWIGTPPEDPWWSDDGRSVFYRQRRAGSDIVDIYRVEVATGRTEGLAPAELGQVEGPGGSWSRDRK